MSLSPSVFAALMASEIAPGRKAYKPGKSLHRGRIHWRVMPGLLQQVLQDFRKARLLLPPVNILLLGDL